MKEFYLESEVADILGISKKSLSKFKKDDFFTNQYKKKKGHINYQILKNLEEFKKLENTRWDIELRTKPKRKFHIIELFAGAGGLAIGLKNAGFNTLLLNDIDKDSCKTLSKNTDYEIINDDIKNLCFKKYKDKIDVLSGGFPCQAFSYAGKKLGFKDTRGTLFYEFAKRVQECNPKVILAENVKGLQSHDNGRTLATICNVIDEIGYDLVEPKVLKAIFYQVPQKRERLIMVATRKDLNARDLFKYPDPCSKIYTLKDALKKGKLYSTNCPKSDGSIYPNKKKKVLDLVPPGGYWRDLPDKIQREFMGNSYFLGGGKTGLARRLSWEEPSLTLTCAPAQGQTERCHPSQTRPLTVREYARIQTFTDNWKFEGSLSS